MASALSLSESDSSFISGLLARKRTEVEEALRRNLPEEKTHPEALHRAMNYSVFSGGKRLRPILALLSSEALGASTSAILPAACAVEFIHTYSLIHDDLPAMDDDDTRRGRPTCHKVFGDAMAILAGDALLTLAFETIVANYREAQLARRLTLELASAAGAKGMVGGQALDLDTAPIETGSADLAHEIHLLKTASLFAAASRMGAMVAGGSEKVLGQIGLYGESIGLAFQIVDDIMDELKSPEEIGKATRKDRARGKLTMPRVVGLEESRQMARAFTSQAVKALEGLSSTRPLQVLAMYLLEREK